MRFHFRKNRSSVWLQGKGNCAAPISTEYVQALMGHADEKMTKEYQEGHKAKEIEYVEVGAGLAL